MKAMMECRHIRLSVLTETLAWFGAGAFANGAPCAQASSLPYHADCMEELARLQLENANLKRALAACSDAPPAATDAGTLVKLAMASR